MRHIAAIDDGKIPRDDDFNFRIRAKNLVCKWHPIIITNKPTASSDFYSSQREIGLKSLGIKRRMRRRNVSKILI